MAIRTLTIFRPVLFCLLCAIALAITSGMVKGLYTEWNQHLLLMVAIAINYGLTILFTRWEKLQLKNVGVVANNATVKKVTAGFGIGLFMALLQAVFILLLGHFKIS